MALTGRRGGIFIIQGDFLTISLKLNNYWQVLSSNYHFQLQRSSYIFTLSPLKITPSSKTLIEFIA